MCLGHPRRQCCPSATSSHEAEPIDAARLFDFTVSDQGLQIIDTNRLSSIL